MRLAGLDLQPERCVAAGEPLALGEPARLGQDDRASGRGSPSAGFAQASV